MVETVITDDGPRFPGVYVLLLGLEKDTPIPVGRLGTSIFPKGWYAYVGSAMGGLSGRIRHHRRQAHPRPHWHIDYLVPHCALSAVLAARTSERLECDLAALLAERFSVIPRFGSSDCRCLGHLLHSEDGELITNAAMAAIKAVGCRPEVVLLSSGRPQLAEVSCHQSTGRVHGVEG
ncbi:MAG: GIY-YIG nuclease family protein [Dehalococcoidia bacterium]